MIWTQCKQHRKLKSIHMPIGVDVRWQNYRNIFSSHRLHSLIVVIAIVVSSTKTIEEWDWDLENTRRRCTIRLNYAWEGGRERNILFANGPLRILFFHISCWNVRFVCSRSFVPKVYISIQLECDFTKIQFILMKLRWVDTKSNWLFTQNFQLACDLVVGILKCGTIVFGVRRQRWIRQQQQQIRRRTNMNVRENKVLGQKANKCWLNE